MEVSNGQCRYLVTLLNTLWRDHRLSGSRLEPIGICLETDERLVEQHALYQEDPTAASTQVPSGWSNTVPRGHTESSNGDRVGNLGKKCRASRDVANSWRCSPSRANRTTDMKVAKIADSALSILPRGRTMEDTWSSALRFGSVIGENRRPPDQW